MPYRCQVCNDCESETDIYQSDSDYPSDLESRSRRYPKRHGNSRRNHRRENRDRHNRTGHSADRDRSYRDRRNRWRHQRPRPRSPSPSRGQEKSASDSSTQSVKSLKSNRSHSSSSESYSSNSESYSSNSESHSSKTDSVHSDSDSDEFEKLCVTSPCSSESDDDVNDAVKNVNDTETNTNKKGAVSLGKEATQANQGDKIEATEKTSEDLKGENDKTRDERKNNQESNKIDIEEKTSENVKDQNEKREDSKDSESGENEIAREQGKRVKRYAKGRGNYKPRSTHKTHSRVKRSFVKMATGKKVSVTVPKPKTWKCGTQSTLITLRRKGKMSGFEYRAVAREMSRTIVNHASCETGGGCFKKYKILKIQKVINGCLWKRYRHRQEQIRAEVKFVNQRMLFHGSKNIDDIVQSGFDERYSAVDGMFGAGLYFAKHSSKANQYAFGYMGGTGCPVHKDKGCMICERKMLLCRVTLGKTRNFFTANKLAHPPVGYNSVTGLPSTQEHGLKYPEFIVYRGEQVYPEYVITYKISN